MLQEQLHKSGFCAMAIGALLLPLLFCERNEIPDLDEYAESKSTKSLFGTANPLENPQFIERMRGVILNCVEFGWI